MKKKKGKSAGTSSSGDLIARVRQALGKGNTREAVELAKELVRAQPGGESEAILADAYTARVEALLRSGLAKEAGSLADLVAGRYPALRDRFTGLARRMDLAGGDLDSLLERIAGAEPVERQSLERELTPWLSDPATISGSQRLSASDPLRVAAGAIADLFQAVTSGPVTPEAMSVLDTIPRQSPLAPWKLLIRAIEAFHRGDDARASANLDAIPPQAPVSRVRTVVERLTSPAPAGQEDPLSPAADALRLAVGGDREEVTRTLHDLEETFHERHPREAARSLRRVADAFRGNPSRRVVIATLFRAGFRHFLTPGQVTRALGLGADDLEMLRLAALAFEEVAPLGAVGLWDGFLEKALQQKTIAPGWETATVLLHMAELCHDQSDDDPFDDFFDDESDGLDEVAESLGGRIGLLERALGESRDRRVYHALVRDDLPRARHWVAQWRKEHPREIEPLLLLLEIEEREKHYAAALELAKEGVAIDPSNTELRARTLRLLLRATEEALGKKAFVQARDFLAQLEAERSQFGETGVWLDALKIAATEEKHARYALADTFPNFLHNPSLAMLLTNAVRVRFGTLIPAQSAVPEPVGAMDAILRLFALRARWGVEIPLPTGLVASACEAMATVGTGDLVLLARGAMQSSERELAWTAATEGLSREEATAPVFLWVRGELLLATAQKERAMRCLHAARELARASREMDLVREVNMTIHRLVHHRTGDSHEVSFDLPSARRVLSQERELRDAPSSTAKRRRRKKRGPGLEMNRDLF